MTGIRWKLGCTRSSTACLPAATAALVEGRIRVDGRKVTIDGGST